MTGLNYNGGVVLENIEVKNGKLTLTGHEYEEYYPVDKKYYELQKGGSYYAVNHEKAILALGRDTDTISQVIDVLGTEAYRLTAKFYEILHYSYMKRNTGDLVYTIMNKITGY